MTKALSTNVRMQIIQAEALVKALAAASSPPEVREIESKLDAIEDYMKHAGLYRTEDIRPVNEGRMWARWRLGQLLDKVERKGGPGRGKKNADDRPSFKAQLKQWSLDRHIAEAAQRISTLPTSDLEKALAWARQCDILNTFENLIELARPYWYKANRQRRHRKIARDSAQNQTRGIIGPFPLILADPPWKFEVYSEKGLDRTPDQHYPTMGDDDIAAFRVEGKLISEIATRDAALFMWCTSSNIHRALRIMEAWDFEYKTHAIWAKDRSGMGLVFRNMHEVLLYGTRGKMPGPQYQPQSVFHLPRGKHSAKPTEIRKAIERMYPDFDDTTRLELFAREKPKGWTVYGHEAFDQAAE